MGVGGYTIRACMCKAYVTRVRRGYVTRMWRGWGRVCRGCGLLTPCMAGLGVLVPADVSAQGHQAPEGAPVCRSVERAEGAGWLRKAFRLLTFLVAGFGRRVLPVFRRCG